MYSISAPCGHVTRVSGVSGTSDSYTTLPNAFSGVYATLATSLVSTVLASGTPYLPSGVLLNVNYPAVDNGCTAPKLVLTRQTSANLLGTDVQICSYTDKRLPTESTVLDSAGCWASVTVLTASKVDASAALQEQVYKKLNTVLTCYTQA
ncbi:hypothetical protein BKA62DRAFT_155727 [Auriculariales sp. MPI-PUGE-AT-0066]|nr:hypothetical protein BKA62DRAFT_155727 [Auriculariales sp. MPI-PUGE-AT-0066]